MLPLAEVHVVLSRPKELVSDMRWTARRGKIDWGWVEARLLLRYVDEYETAEQLYVLCQWRKRGHSIAEQWKFAVFYKDKRVFAFDLQPSAYHVNDKAGRGRPIYGRDLEGAHEHTWSSEGYGYAEPLNMDLLTTEILWRMFLKRAGIGNAEFYHPDNNEPELI